MRKAYLAKHYDPAPCPVAEEMEYRYRFTGQYLDNNEILEIDAYDNSDKPPVFRHFINFDTGEYWTLPLEDMFPVPVYGQRTYDIIKGKWTQARLDTLLEAGRYVEHGGDYFITEELKEWILQDIGESYFYGRSIIGRLESWERNAQAEKLCNQHKVRVERIREMFNTLQDKEQEIYEWAKDNLFKHYALIEPLKKTFRLKCSYCMNTWIKKKKPKHRQDVMCPFCGNALKVNVRKKNIADKIRVYQTEPWNNGALIRHYDIYRRISFSEEKGEWISWHAVDEVQRAVIDADGKWKRSFWRTDRDKERGYTFEDTKGYGNYIINGKGYLYPEDIYYPGRTETDLMMYRLMAEDFIKAPWNERQLTYRDIPEFTEYLWKSGLKKIADRVMAYPIYGHYAYSGINNPLNINAKTLPELLNLDSNMTARIKHLDIGIDTLEFLQVFQGHISDQTIKDIDRIGADNLMLAKTGLSPIKAVNYIRKQEESGDFTSLNEVLTMYKDYLGMAERDGQDLHDDIVRLCKNLRECHDALVEQRETNKNKERFKRCKGVNKRYKPYLTIYGWADDDFTVMIPKKAEDIFREGQKQHHCVGKLNYMEKHASGDTMILFLRKKDHPQTPWYTLEVDPKDLKIKQRYAMYDRQPELETADRELEKWKREVKRRLKKPNRQVREALEMLKAM